MRGAKNSSHPDTENNDGEDDTDDNNGDEQREEWTEKHSSAPLCFAARTVTKTSLIESRTVSLMFVVMFGMELI